MRIFTFQFGLIFTIMLISAVTFYGWAANASGIFAAMAASTLNWCF